MFTFSSLISSRLSVVSITKLLSTRVSVVLTASCRFLLSTHKSIGGRLIDRIFFIVAVLTNQHPKPQQRFEFQVKELISQPS